MLQSYSSRSAAAFAPSNLPVLTGSRASDAAYINYFRTQSGGGYYSLHEYMSGHKGANTRQHHIFNAAFDSEIGQSVLQMKKGAFLALDLDISAIDRSFHNIRLALQQGAEYVLVHAQRTPFRPETIHSIALMARIGRIDYQDSWGRPMPGYIAAAIRRNFCGYFVADHQVEQQKKYPGDYACALYTLLNLKKFHDAGANGLAPVVADITQEMLLAARQRHAGAVIGWIESRGKILDWQKYEFLDRLKDLRDGLPYDPGKHDAGNRAQPGQVVPFRPANARASGGLHSSLH